MDEVIGKLKVVVFHNNDNLYSVIKVRTDEDDKYLTIVGNFSIPNNNSNYKYFGEYYNHPRFGTQFVATRHEELLPSSKEETLRYLCSPLFKKIGVKTATKIVDTLGEDALNQIKENHSILDGLVLEYTGPKKRFRYSCSNNSTILGVRLCFWFLAKSTTIQRNFQSGLLRPMRHESRMHHFILRALIKRQADRNQETYHDFNIYWELADKYGIENILINFATKNGYDRVVLQGEGVGSVQGNPYKFTENQLFIFNLVVNGTRLGTIEMVEFCNQNNLTHVPIISTEYILPKTMEEMKLEADGYSEINPKVKREGFVYRSIDGQQSFKNVSREYLLKHS